MQSSLKKIGNSFGVILNKKLLSEAGITDTEIIIEAKKNTIIISPVTNRRPVNKDLSTWRRQIKAAIKKEQKPGKSVWGNQISEAEEKEWEW